MKKKIFAIATIIVLLLGLCIPRGSRVRASGGNLCSESILPPDYRDPGDTSPYLFDARFPTMTGNTLIYKDGRIGILLYNCSYTGIYNYDPGRYLMQTFIRKSNGEMIYLNVVDRGALLNNWSDVRRVGPVDVHKTFDYDPVYIEGASPLKPNISFKYGSGYEVRASFSGSCDWNQTKYSFDYYGIDKYTGKTSYIEDEYTYMKADDYICGFYYMIDERGYDVPFDWKWNRVNSSDYSGNTRELNVKIPQDKVSTQKDYYLHLAAISYTGKVSPVSSAKIPKRGIHSVRYMMNGGEGSIPDTLKLAGRAVNLSEIVPKRIGHTFQYWKADRHERYNPGQEYTRDQDEGFYYLKAQWKKNTYRFVFDPNSQGGKNGKISGTMPDMICDMDKKGLPSCGFKNEDVDDFGFNKFKFRGWSTNPNAISAEYPLEKLEGTEIAQIIRKSDMAYTDGGEIRLYAIWDKQPELKGVKDRYITSNQIKDIKESDLVRGIYGEDREDGRIDKVSLVDYSRDLLKLTGDRCAVKLTCEVKDSAGNITRGNFWVNIVSSSPIVDETNSQMYIRFIDRANYDRGSLISDSIWYRNKSYKETFMNINPSKPKKVVKFTL